MKLFATLATSALLLASTASFAETLPLAQMVKNYPLSLINLWLTMVVKTVR